MKQQIIVNNADYIQVRLFVMNMEQKSGNYTPKKQKK